MPHMVEPFIFLSLAIQVFFLDVVEKPRWKFVLCKETRAKHEVVETTNTVINTVLETVWLTIPQRWPLLAQSANLVKAIELSPKENLLA